MSGLFSFRRLLWQASRASAPAPLALAKPCASGGAWQIGAPLAIVLLPLLLLLIDANWILPRPDTVDPWMYVAHFLAPGWEASIDHWQYEYHAGRLPIILPGAFICRLLPLETALIVLHLGLYYVALFSLFGALQNLTERRTALLVSLAAGGYAMFLSTMGLGQADAFGVAYALATIYFVTRAITGVGWRRPLFAAGMLAALFVFTNIAYSPFLLGFCWLLGTLPRDVVAKPLKVGAAQVALGFGAAVIALSAASAALGGSILFFRSSLSYAAHTAWIRDLYAPPFSDWTRHAVWLVVPFILLFATGALWRRRGALKLHQAHVLRSCGGAFAGLFAFMTVSEAIKAVRYLDVSFYASLIMPWLFMAAGACVAPFVQRWSTATFRAALAAEVVLSAITLTCVRGGAMPSTTVGWVLVLSLLVGAGLSALRPEVARKHAGALAVAMFGALNLLITLSFEGFQNEFPLERPHAIGRHWVGTWHDPLSGTMAEPAVSRAQVCQVVARAHRTMAPFDLSRMAPLWYSVDSAYGSLFNAISATRYWDTTWLSPRFPSANWLEHRTIELPPGRVFLLTHDGHEDIETVYAVAKFHGLKSSLVAQESFREEFGVPITLTVFDLTPDDDVSANNPGSP